MRSRSERSERGAIIIQVAVCLLGLTAFSAIVIDYGILWSARSQAQNAADAGAMAGTVARAFDDTNTDEPFADGSGKVSASINGAVQANWIWGVATPSAATDIGYTCPTGYTGRCVQVTVHRDGADGKSQAIPTWFAGLVGVNEQHIVATATGHVGIGNSTTCMKPWLVPDRWLEDPATDPDQYNAPGDSYSPFGWKTANVGDFIVLQPGNTQAGQLETPNDFYRIKTSDDPNEYQQAIEGCTFKAKIGDSLEVRADDGTPSPLTAPSVETLISQDPSSTWDVPGKKVTGGCNAHCGGSGGSAPRMALIGLYNPNEFDANKAPSGTFNVTLINIVSVYILGMDAGGGINGFITSKAGGFIESGATPVEDASFLPVTQLIR